MYDLIIVGGGAAALSAAIYSSRYKLSTLIIAKEFGGTANYGHKIENYPGVNNISGINLMKKFKEHAENFGTKTINDDVTDIEKKKDFFEVKTTKKIYNSKTIILALGTQRRKLNVPGEDRYLGRGVSYCAICDAAFFKDKIVGVIGGGDSASKSAILITQYAKKVYMIFRKDKLTAEPALVDQINKNKKIDLIPKTNVLEIKGNKFVTGVSLDSKKQLKLDGLFIEIGSIPNPSLIKKIGVSTDKNGYIKVKEDMSTNILGVYAAGDITTGSNRLRQIVTAASEGSIAAYSIYNLLKK